MKKFMVIAAVAIVAACAQAVPVSWTVMGISYNASAPTGGNALLFVIGQNGVTSSSQITALITAGTDVSGYASGTAGTVAANGGVSVGTAASGINYAWTSGTQTYTAFAIVFNASTQTGSDDYLLTTEKTITISSATGSKSFSFGNVSALSWTAVPEPTSMALLGLGVAALAFRRKFRK